MSLGQQSATDAAGDWSHITQGPTADAGTSLTQTSPAEATMALPIVSSAELAQAACQTDSDLESEGEISDADDSKCSKSKSKDVKTPTVKSASEGKEKFY